MLHLFWPVRASTAQWVENNWFRVEPACRRYATGVNRGVPTACWAGALLFSATHAAL
jgi:hypothetical protein